LLGCRTAVGEQNYQAEQEYSILHNHKFKVGVLGEVADQLLFTDSKKRSADC
jgi:hypothetical protein